MKLLGPIIRREVSGTGSGLTNCGINLGKGTWELQSVTLRVGLHYACISNVRIRHTIQNVNVWDRLVSGPVSNPQPLLMPFRRMIEGPCRIHAEVTFPESSTITLVTTYRRVIK